MKMNHHKFDKGDVVYWVSKETMWVVENPCDEDGDVILVDFNGGCWTHTQEKQLELVKPANWRVGDILNDGTKIVEVFSQPDDSDYIARCSDGEEILKPAESRFGLKYRPNVPMYNSSDTSMHKCPDCKDFGEIVLFTSIVKCDCR